MNSNRIGFSAIPALLLFAALALPAGNVTAQDIKSVAGTYTIVTAKVFGDKPRGQLMLGSDGRYSLMLSRTTLPKIAAGTRDKGTAEENKAIVGGINAHFGKYTIDSKDKTITFHIETCSFPNWEGTTQKRTLKLSGDLLTYTVATTSDGGGASDVVWRRIK